jgi:hypothetical protein
MVNLWGSRRERPVRNLIVGRKSAVKRKRVAVDRSSEIPAKKISAGVIEKLRVRGVRRENRGKSPLLLYHTMFMDMDTKSSKRP